MPTANTTIDNLIADFQYCAATLPTNLPPRWSAKFMAIFSGLYELKASWNGGTAPALTNGTAPDAIRGLLQRAGASGMTLDEIAAASGKSALACTKALGVLTATGSVIGPSGSGIYTSVHAGNVRSVAPGKTQQGATKRRGRPPGQQQQGTGTSG